MSLKCFFCPAVQKPSLVKVINFYQRVFDILLKDFILKIVAIYCL